MLSPYCKGKHGKHNHSTTSRVSSKNYTEGTIVDEDNLNVYISEYYMRLVGEPAKNSFTMREDKARIKEMSSTFCIEIFNSFLLLQITAFKV
jgi:hypothetical protein